MERKQVLDKIKDFFKRHKKGTIIGYVLLCLLYMIVQLVRPRSQQYIGLYSVKGIIMYTIIFLCAGIAMYAVAFIEPINGQTPKSKLRFPETILKLWEKYRTRKMPR